MQYALPQKSKLFLTVGAALRGRPSLRIQTPGAATEGRPYSCQGQYRLRSQVGQRSRMRALFEHAKGLFADPPATAGGTDFGLWLFVPPGKIATVALGAVGIDPVAFDHPVERASIDAEDLGGARAVPAGDLEHIQQVTSFKLVEHRQIFKQSRQR